MDTCSSPPDIDRGKGRRHDRLEVRQDVRIAVREVRLSEGAASGNVVSDQAHQLEGEAGVVAEAGHRPGNSDLVSDDELVERLPASCGQEWMVVGDLHQPASLGADPKALLDAAVDPVRHVRTGDATLAVNAPDLPETAIHALFDGEALACLRIVDQHFRGETLTHTRSSRYHNQIGVFEAVGHTIDVMEAARNTDHGPT